jgi:hypothetical protein
MVELYPNDFKVVSVVVRYRFHNYIWNVRSEPNFAKLKGLLDIGAKLVKTNKCTTFEVVYKLLKLVMILPVISASVKHVFPAMKYVKTQLNNKIGDQ